MKASTHGFNPEYSEDAPSLEDIETSSGVVILEFGAPWCGHCQAALPVIKDVVQNATKDHPELVHIKVFDGKGKRLGRQFGVKLWPTLVVLKNGQEQKRAVRVTSTEEVKQLFL